jgi:SH3 domain protein
MRKILIGTLLVFITGSAIAETLYVDDRLVITMRSGKGNQYQILETLPSGSRMELLETDGEYSRVRLNDGTEGWVLSQYLTKTPIARDLLGRANKRIDRLQDENKQLQQQISNLKSEKENLSSERSSLNSETDKLRDELAQLKEVSARPIELAENNRQLKETLNTLRQKNEELVTENAQLSDRSQREWFITGAAVLLGGIFLGLILPLLRRRKKAGMFD